MSVVLALPDKDTIAPLEFFHNGHDIEGWPHPRGGYDVWVIDPEGNEFEVGKAEEPTDVRGTGVDWIDGPPDERFYVGATVVNRRSGNVYFVRAVIDGRLVLGYQGKPKIRNAKRANWRVADCRVRR